MPEKKIIIILCFLLFTSCKVWSQVMDTVCNGAKGSVYSVEHHAGSHFLWTVKGGNIRTGNGTNSILVDWKDRPGLYRISVIEQNELSCTGDTVYGEVLIKGKMFTVDYPDKACLNDSVTLKAGGGIRYLWSNGSEDSITKIRLTADTSFLVKISDTTCGIRTDSLSIHIKAIRPSGVSFTSDAADFYKDRYSSFTYAGNKNDKVTWEIEKSDIGRITSHGVNVKFIDTGEAHIRVISRNQFGCIDSAEKVIEIKDEQLFFPNAFTPNGDGINDEFKPGGVGIKFFHLQIFNGWGQKMFETNNMKEGWNGYYNGDPVIDGVYTYVGEAMGPSGKIFNFSGNITVLR